MTDATAYRPPPKHYAMKAPDGREVEPWDVIEAAGLAGDYFVATAVQYLLRCKHKGSEAEDVRKARDYLARALERLERPEPAG